MRGAYPFALVLAVALVACGPEPVVRELEPIPEPQLGRVDPAVREQLTDERAKLDQLFEEDAADKRLAAALGRMGQFYHAYDLLEPAAACYRNAHQLDPGAFRWLYYLGAVYQRQGKFDQAAEMFAAALALRPNDAATLLRLGNVEVARNQPQTAGPYFERALAAEPRCFAARYGLGEVARARGELEVAAEHYQRILAEQPQAVRVHYPLAQTLLRLGRSQEAQVHLDASAAREVSVGGRPTCPDPLDAELGSFTTGAAVHLTRGRHASFAGRFDIELAEFRKAVELAPEDPIAHQSLASALFRGGELQEALEHYREAARHDPDNADFRHDLGVVAMRLGDYGAARAYFTEALELRPDFPRVQLQLAQIAQRLRDFATAVELYDQYLPTDASNHRVRVQRAFCLAKIGRRSEAIAEVDRMFEEAAPEDNAALVNLASALGGLGEVDRAIEILEAIIALPIEEPVRAQAHLRIAAILEARGSAAEAVGHYRSAIELDPALEPARKALERLGRGRGG